MTPLFFSGSFPEGNKSNARIKNIARLLDNLGKEVRFYSFGPLEHPQEDERKGNWNGMPYHYLYPSHKRPKSSLLRHIFRLYTLFCAGLLLLFRRKKIELIYFYNPRYSDTLLLLKWAKVLRIKTLVDQTEAFTLEKGRLNQREEQCIVKKADLLLVISSALEGHFKHLGRTERIFVFSLIVDIDAFEGAEVEEEPYSLGYLGAFGSNDTVDELIEAFSLARLEQPKLKLKLIGFNSAKEPLRKMVELLSLQDHVEFQGQIKSSSIPKALKSCSILILPRRAKDFSMHGYPNKLGEYFAAHRAVLMSDVGGFSNDFQHKGEVYKYKPHHKLSLIEGLFALLENPNERNSIAQAGFAYCQNNFALSKRQAELQNILVYLNS